MGYELLASSLIAYSNASFSGTDSLDDIRDASEDVASNASPSI